MGNVNNRRIIAGIIILAVAVGGILWSRSQPKPIVLKDAIAISGHRGDVFVSVKLDNRGDPDRLLAVHSSQAQSAEFNISNPAGFAVPGKMTSSLAFDGAHAVLRGLSGDVDEGRMIPFTLVFERNGELMTRARLSGHNMPMGAIELGLDDAPAVSIIAEPSAQGWHIRAELANFRFAPDKLNSPHEPDEGHGHLYVGALKIMRMFENEVEIGPLPPGEHRIRLTLNSNDHQSLLADGRIVAAETVIKVP